MEQPGQEPDPAPMKPCVLTKATDAGSLFLDGEVGERTRDFSCSFSARANCENVKLSHGISKGICKAHAANARGNMAVFGLHSMYLVIYRFGASCWLTTLLICRWFQKISRASLKVHGATRA